MNGKKTNVKEKRKTERERRRKNRGIVTFKEIFVVI
jgi:hypothetical protein